ncbi:hypothetical protein HGRIS_004762 [Hohenbuehelia grisea]|uniref:RING-type E3 ubiquitin transferase n=1 Tax=Hohenbuehelia grisea TaxID=104357 RepID=A0ABR3JCW1_9AGAR
MDRPVTSKARGVCRYYTQPRGCFAGNSCKFLHGEPETEKLTPYDKAKTCRFYAQGYCKRGEQCWFRHVKPANSSPNPIAGPSSAPMEEESSEACCICFEMPVTYGLLAGCSHVFCIVCIRKWRSSADKSIDVVLSGATKKCPMCRTKSRFITPSSIFYPTGHPEKDQVIDRYQQSMAKLPCRFFQASKSKPSGPMCPFGRDCFYQHMNDDGTPYVFREGATASLRNDRNRLRYYAPGTAMAEHAEYLANSLDVLNNLFDNPMQNLSATIDAIRAGLTRIGARMDGREGDGQAAPNPGPDVWGSAGFDDPPELAWERNEDPEREIEGLEILADHMLAQLTSLRSASAEAEDEVGVFDSDDDDNEPMPALEPIRREPHRRPSSASDDMPALQSVSDSSCSGHSSLDNSEAEGSLGWPPRPSVLIPVRGVETSQQLQVSDSPEAEAGPSQQRPEMRRSTSSQTAHQRIPFGIAPRPLPSAACALGPRASIPIPTPSTTITIDDADDDGDDADDESEAIVCEECRPRDASLESPFITDGRGRVVCCGSDAEPGQLPEGAPTVEAVKDGSESPGTAAAPEFMTDGRGRVIGANDGETNVSSNPSEASAGGRGFFGRVLDVMFS